MDGVNSKARIDRIVMEMTGKELSISRSSGAGFRAWVPAWLQYKYTNPKTLHRYQNAWVALMEFFAQRRVDHPGDVTYQMCHDYLQWRSDAELAKEEGRKVVTWNTALTEIRVLGAVMREAVNRGYVSANPTAQLGVSRRNTKRKRMITKEEIEKIEAALPTQPQWMQDSWLVYMKQGVRLSEVEVPLEEIDLEKRSITFIVKGGREHTTALNSKVAELAERRRAEGAKKLVELGRSPSKCWIEFFKSLGIEGISIHCTRVTVITNLLLAGVSEWKVIEFIGHCSREVNMIYRRIQAGHLVDVAEVL